MPFLMLKDLPRYECLLEAAKQFPELDPSACEVFLFLLRAGDQTVRVCDAHLQRHNVSQGRFTVLMLLFDKSTGCPRSLTPAELADMAAVTRATMTGLVDTLERDGMVTRRPDSVDRRMMHVTLTDKGVDFIKGVLPDHFKRMAALMSPLSESERKTLVKLLTKIVAQADTVEPARVPELVDAPGASPH